MLLSHSPSFVSVFIQLGNDEAMFLATFSTIYTTIMHCNIQVFRVVPVQLKALYVQMQPPRISPPCQMPDKWQPTPRQRLKDILERSLDGPTMERREIKASASVTVIYSNQRNRMVRAAAIFMCTHGCSVLTIELKWI